MGRWGAAGRGGRGGGIGSEENEPGRRLDWRLGGRGVYRNSGRSGDGYRRQALLIRAQLVAHPGRQFGLAGGCPACQMKLQVKLEISFVSFCFDLKIWIEFMLRGGEVKLP